jgi:hypothetical protein
VIVEYLRSLENLGYGVEWLIEQERDLPLRWRFLKVEKPTMSELMVDSRIGGDPRAMTALFSPGYSTRRVNRQCEDQGLAACDAGRALEGRRSDRTVQVAEPSQHFF